MATTFPTTVQSLTNVTDNVDYPTAATINYLNDTVEALEAKVGADDSAVSTSHDYILNNKIWPIGSVFLSVVATNPNTLLGFGTWSQIGGGKVLVGQTDGDADFNVAEETGGSKTTSIAHTHTGPSHTHTGTTASGASDNIYSTGTNRTGPTSGHTHTITTNAGGTGVTGAMSDNATPSVVQPYLVTYMWKRTA